MKSKIRNIVVEGKEYNWAVSEIDWDRVLLKVWIHGNKKCPWFTTEKRFNNPWYFVGQVNEDNIEKFQLAPITPKHVAEAISLVLKEYGDPGDIFRTLNVEIEVDGRIGESKDS